MEYIHALCIKYIYTYIDRPLKRERICFIHCVAQIHIENNKKTCSLPKYFKYKKKTNGKH